MKDIENIVNNYMKTSSSQPALMSWEKLEYRVRKYYELMREYCYSNFIVDKPFPDLLVEFDKSKSMTRIFAYANSYKWLLKFSYKLIDGRYNYSFTDDIIRHEIGHLITDRLFKEEEPHGKNFQKLGKIFLYDSASAIDENKFLLSHFSKIDDCEYCLECKDCGKRYYYHRKSSRVKNYRMYVCGKCNGELKMIKGEEE